MLIIGRLGYVLAGTLKMLSLPTSIIQLLKYFDFKASQIDPLVSLGFNLILGYLAAQLILWIFKLPLSTIWPVFGFLSGNNPNILSWYNILAHIFAFVIAFKIIFDVRSAKQ